MGNQKKKKKLKFRREKEKKKKLKKKKPSFAATYAKGYPVALEAKADERDKRAFTSMMRNSSELGSTAYWMLHSPTTPRRRIILMAHWRRRK